MANSPVAFMSYVRFDDQHENGRLTEFCKRLSGEIRMQTGDEFPIFQDRNDIIWGQEWRTRIKESLDAVTFLIPILTPGFFKSDACRDEFELFLQRERDLGRTDLILPVHYVNCPVLSHPKKREADAVAQVLATRQFADWRELRFEPFAAPQVGRTLASIAAQVIQAIERAAPPPTDALTRPAATGRQRPISEPGPSATPAHTPAPVAESRAKDAVDRGAPRSDPPTRVVDAMHRGDFATVSEALKAAKPGDRILVRPGRYSEGLIIDKALEIVGDGELNDIVIEASGADVVLFRAGMGRIANLTLRQVGDGKWFGIDITQGRLDVEGCDISSRSLACVAVRGGADPRLRRNRIHHGASAGVYVYDNGAGTFEDNDIHANASAGVAVKTGASPTIRRNRIHDNSGSGVFVYERGLGVIDDNEIFGNVFAGVSVSEESAPVVRGNRIRDGKAGGVFVYGKGGGTFENNDIFANAMAAVEVKEESAPTVRGNKIHDGKGAGIYLNGKAAGTYEGNEIFGNVFAGVSVSEESSPVVRGNRIADGKAGGIFIFDKAAGTYENNDVTGNALSGVEVKGGATPVVRGNRVSDNKAAGVYVNGGASGTFEDNDIWANTLAGVAASEGAAPVVRGNRIYDGKAGGVFVFDKAAGTYDGNTVRHNALAGFEIKEGASPIVRDNRVHDNQGSGVFVHSAAGGTFTNNVLSDNVKGSWSIAEDCLQLVTRSDNTE